MAKFKLHNGKEVEIPDEFLPDFEELGKGYMRQDDYTRKRQAEAAQLQQLQAQLQQSAEAAQQAQAWAQWWENGGKQMYEQYNSQQADDLLSDGDYRSHFDSMWGQRYGQAQQEIAAYVQQMMQPLLRDVQRTQSWARHIDSINRLAHAHYSGPLKGEPFRYDDLQKHAVERGRSDLAFEDWQGYYNEIYRDPLMNVEVERKAKEAESARIEKDKASIISGKTGTSSGSIFTMPAEVPASRDEANQSAIEHLRGERIKRGE